MINIGLAGAEGRVGQLVIKAIDEDENYFLAAKFVQNFDPQNISKSIDVIIDFSAVEAVNKHLKICLDNNYRYVLGVTGISQEQKHLLIEASKKIPIVFAPNMSIGMNITFKILELTENILKKLPEHEVALLDFHHKHKKDAPSGTALKMAEVINSVSDRKIDVKTAISSIRAGDTIGEHSAIFTLAGERIEITHRSTNRSLYAKGALQAAKWIIDKKPGLYDMQDVLELKDNSL